MSNENEVVDVPILNGVRLSAPTLGRAVNGVYAAPAGAVIVSINTVDETFNYCYLQINMAQLRMEKRSGKPE